MTGRRLITPNVIIAGAPKCGTTSVFEWLSDHPEVCVSSRKETGYFIDRGDPLFDEGANYHVQGIEGYGRFFAHCAPGRAGVILEATPDYINQTTAIEVIPTLTPRPLVVFILRRPSERIYSSFQFSRNNLSILPKEMTFSEFIGLGADSGKDPASAAVLRVALDQTRYAEHISRWIASAGAASVSVFLFESLRDGQSGFMKAFSERIGIDAGFWDGYGFKRINESYRVKSQFMHRMVRKVSTSVPGLTRQGFLKKAYGLVNKESPSQASAEDKEAMRRLDESFRTHNAALAGLLKMDLSAWR